MDETTNQNEQKFSVLAIVALILAFFLPIIGLILGIIALVKINKNEMKGKVIAIVAIIIGGIWSLIFFILILNLAYFGVLEPDNYLPEKCTLPSGLGCLDSAAESSQFKLVVQNSLGYEISDLSVSYTIDSGQPTACQSPTILSNGKTIQITCPGNFKDRLFAEIQVSYTNKASGIEHNKSGSVMLAVN